MNYNSGNNFKKEIGAIKNYRINNYLK
jgi:hypothetical protein